MFISQSCTCMLLLAPTIQLQFDTQLKRYKFQTLPSVIQGYTKRSIKDIVYNQEIKGHISKVFIVFTKWTISWDTLKSKLNNQNEKSKIYTSFI